jgi:hypothetical protein
LAISGLISSRIDVIDCCAVARAACALPAASCAWRASLAATTIAPI